MSTSSRKEEGPGFSRRRTWHNSDYPRKKKTLRGATCSSRDFGVESPIPLPPERLLKGQPTGRRSPELTPPNNKFSQATRLVRPSIVFPPRLFDCRKFA